MEGNVTASYEHEALEALPYGVFISDAEGYVLYSNTRYKEDYHNDTKVWKPSEREQLHSSLLELLDKLKTDGKGDTVGEVLYLPDKYDNRGNRIERYVSVRRLQDAQLAGNYMGIIEDAEFANLQEDLKRARTLQMNMLPENQCMQGGIRYGYRYKAAHMIGGDMINVYATDRYPEQKAKDTMAVLTDVSGHGTLGSLLAVFTKASWDMTEISPANAFADFYQKFKKLEIADDTYITGVACRIDQTAQKIIYSYAGHDAPLFLKHGNTVRVFRQERSCVISDVWYRGNVHYADSEEVFSDGDIFVMMSDGILACTDQNNSIIDEAYIERLLLRSRSATEFLDNLWRVKSDVQPDDCTVLAFDLTDREEA